MSDYSDLLDETATEIRGMMADGVEMLLRDHMIVWADDRIVELEAEVERLLAKDSSEGVDYGD